jgi:hypothetical protein
MRAHRHRELHRLLNLKPTNAEGRHLRDAVIVDAQDKLLIFLRRRHVEPKQCRVSVGPAGGSN